jgi:hypothetical protein
MARRDEPDSLTQAKVVFEGSSETDPQIRYRRKDGIAAAEIDALLSAKMVT